MTIVDLGAAPGGWSQYAVTQINAAASLLRSFTYGSIVGVDFLQGDFRDELVLALQA